jgi:tRNA (guanine37-N1)-methyltransferase
MIVHIISLFPEAFTSYFAWSILQKAQEKGKLTIKLYNLADYSVRNTRRVDDRPYGGFPGTIIQAEPVYRVIEKIENNVGKTLPKIFFAPAGERLIQKTLETWSREAECILLCGHYEGVDERILEHFSFTQISLGDYVVTSGEVAAMVFVDGVTRLIPGVIGDESLQEESFSIALDHKKEYPQYTRPDEFLGMRVPEVLLSGDHRKIEQWKRDNRR